MVITLLQTFKLAIALLAFYAYYSSLSFHQKKSVYISFFGVSVLYSIFSLLFFYDFLPGNWTPSVPFQYFVLTLFILLASLFSSLAFLVIPSGFFTAQKYKLPETCYPFLFGFLFFTADIMRSLLLSVFYLGKESSVGLRLFLGSFGETLTFTPLSLFAYKGGVYLLTFVFAMVSYLIFSFYKKKLSRKTVFFSLSFLVIWYVLLLCLPRSLLPDISVDVVTTKFQDPDRTNFMENYKERHATLSSLLLREPQISEETKTLLIFPESTSFLRMQDYFENKKNGYSYSYVLDSGNLKKGGERYAYSFFYDTKNDVTEVRAKDDLMIFSEYSSYLANFLYTTLSNSATIREYERQIQTTRGNSYHIFSLTGTPYTFASMLCSEATSYRSILLFEKSSPSFYVLQSNLVVMKGRPLSLVEYYNYSKLLALTTGKPVISVSNSAPSFTYDGYGRKIKEMGVGNALHSAF